MNLGELIDVLKEYPSDALAAHGFHDPHSYRGTYAFLAFAPTENVTVGSMLAAARSAVSETYEGWKGGYYTMDHDTPVYLAARGEVTEGDDDAELSHGELRRMLTSSQPINVEQIAREILIELYRGGVVTSIDGAAEDKVRVAIKSSLSRPGSTS